MKSIEVIRLESLVGIIDWFGFGRKLSRSVLARNGHGERGPERGIRARLVA
jgi:hypothetical protein